VVSPDEIIVDAKKWRKINEKYNLITQSELDNLYQAHIRFT
jgi:16S rRNA G527 N7-methylase RsmG